MAITLFRVVKRLTYENRDVDAKGAPITSVSWLTVWNDYILTCDTGKATEVRHLVNLLFNMEAAFYRAEEIQYIAVYELKEGQKLTLDSKCQMWKWLHGGSWSDPDGELDYRFKIKYEEKYTSFLTPQTYTALDRVAGYYSPNAQMHSSVGAETKREGLFTSVDIVWNKVLGPPLVQKYWGVIGREYVFKDNGRVGLPFHGTFAEKLFPRFEFAAKQLKGYWCEYYLDEHDVCRLGYRPFSAPVLRCASLMRMVERRHFFPSADLHHYRAGLAYITKQIYDELLLMEKRSNRYKCNAWFEIPNNEHCKRILSWLRVLKRHLVRSLFDPNFDYDWLNWDLNQEFWKSPAWGSNQYGSFPIPGTLDVRAWNPSKVARKAELNLPFDVDRKPTTVLKCNKQNALKAIDRLDQHIKWLENVHSIKNDVYRLPSMDENGSADERFWQKWSRRFENVDGSDWPGKKIIWYPQQYTGTQARISVGNDFNTTLNNGSFYPVLRLRKSQQTQRRKQHLPTAIDGYHEQMETCLRVTAVLAFIDTALAVTDSKANKLAKGFCKIGEFPRLQRQHPGYTRAAILKFYGSEKAMLAKERELALSDKKRVYPAEPPKKPFYMCRPFDYDRRTIRDEMTPPELDDDPEKDPEELPPIPFILPPMGRDGDKEACCDDCDREQTNAETRSKVWNQSWVGRHFRDYIPNPSSGDWRELLEEGTKVVGVWAYDTIKSATYKTGLGVVMYYVRPEGVFVIKELAGQINPYDNKEDLAQDVLDYVADRENLGAKEMLESTKRTGGPKTHPAKPPTSAPKQPPPPAKPDPDTGRLPRWDDVVKEMNRIREITGRDPWPF